MKISKPGRIILDPTARADEKDDAATYIAEFEGEKALAPLIQASLNPKENDIPVLSDYGSAIAELWVKKGIFDLKTYLSLPGDTKGGVFDVLDYKKPAWVKKYGFYEEGFEPFPD